MKKYKYKIINLDCAACALKVQDNLNKNSNLKNVIINYSTSKISYETSLEDTEALKLINEIIDKIEPGVKVVKEEVIKKEYSIYYLIMALLLTLVGSLKFRNHEIFLYIAYLVVLYKPFLKAIKMLVRSHTINENLLICISSIGALLIGAHLEGIMVASLYLLGKILEEKAVNKTRTSVQELLTLKQNYANLKVGENIVEIPVEEVKLGDILCIKNGEKVPVDGVITNGKTKFDTSSLTGEAELLELKKNDKVLSGYINEDEVIEIKATKVYKDSTVAKILELVENASDKKASVETLVSRLSKIYTPIILVLAILVILVLPLFNISFKDSLYRALTFLVISCPCAIAISVPLSYFTGIGVSSKNGILIKGSNYLDNLSKMKKIIFDKTGTLTTGEFQVTDIQVHDKNYKKDEIIEILRCGESFSDHPIAKSIMKLSTKKVNTKNIKDYKEINGVGISFKLGKDLIKIGTKKVCDDNCCYDVSVHLNINSKHVASILIDDGIKDEAYLTIKKLKEEAIEPYLFTGDKEEVAKEISKTLDIDKFYFSMLPQDKYLKYEEIENNEVVAFVGDGINDAPVLKRAKIGISMGNLGSDAAITSSDIVIMNDDLLKIPLAIKISKYTNLIIKENLIFALGVKVIILILSLFGLSSMWFAVFSDTGVTVLTILNTLRILLKFRNNK